MKKLRINRKQEVSFIDFIKKIPKHHNHHLQPSFLTLLIYLVTIKITHSKPTISYKMESQVRVKYISIELSSSFLGRFGSLGRRFWFLFCTSFLWQQHWINVWKHSSMSNGDSLQQLSKLLIVPHG